MKIILQERLTRIAAIYGYEVNKLKEGWFEVLSEQSEDRGQIVSYHCECLLDDREALIALDLQAIGDSEFSLWIEEVDEEGGTFESVWLFITDVPRGMFQYDLDTRLATAVDLLTSLSESTTADPVEVEKVKEANEILKTTCIYKIEDYRQGLMSELNSFIGNGMARELSYEEKLCVIDDMIFDDDLANAQDTAMSYAIEQITADEEA